MALPQFETHASFTSTDARKTSYPLWLLPPKCNCHNPRKPSCTGGISKWKCHQWPSAYACPVPIARYLSATFQGAKLQPKKISQRILNHIEMISPFGPISLGPINLTFKKPPLFLLNWELQLPVALASFPFSSSIFAVFSFSKCSWILCSATLMRIWRYSSKTSCTIQACWESMNANLAEKRLRLWTWTSFAHQQSFSRSILESPAAQQLQVPNHQRASLSPCSCGKKTTRQSMHPTIS